MERLTAEDAAFLRIEDQISAMHSVTVAVFDGPAPHFDDFQDRMASRVSLVPRFRQRVLDVPGGLERPVWADDPQFSLDYHVRHTGLPRGETMAHLEKLTERILSQRLDRGKPLWELWMINSLGDGRWAVLSKAHHSIVDGVSGTDPLTLVVDGLNDDAIRPDEWNPPALPTEAELLGQGLLELGFDPAQQLRLARRAITSPARRSRALFGRPASSSKALVGALGSYRRWGTTQISADAIRELRDSLGVTTNDVVLGLVSAGFRSMFEAADVPTPPTVRTLVPLAVATGSRFANEISSLEADLPTGQPDLAAAITMIHAQELSGGERYRAVAGKTLSELHGLSAPTLATLGLRSAHRTARFADVSTVTVNVPGPAEEITLLDRPLRAVYPAIPLVSKVRISVGVLSYRGQFHFGVTGDSDTALEVGALIEGITEASRLP